MMGRRKIEIKAIKDDRNRSVTFLKRKGGLFKKAHELSVLCSVDVAVIIFGHNKKLYEYSSGDINDTIGRYHYVRRYPLPKWQLTNSNQYGQPHEHKGPADFRGKGGGGDDDDDDDEEDTSQAREESIPPQQQHPQMMPPHVQHQPPFGHLRHPVPSASPPTQNGIFAIPQGSPQPHIVSRPSSRDTTRRSSSNLVPTQHSKASTPQPGHNGFGYVSTQPLYDPRAHPNLNPPPTAPAQFQHFPHHLTPQPIQAQPQTHPQHPSPKPLQHQQQQQQQQQHHHQPPAPPPPPPPSARPQPQPQSQPQQAHHPSIQAPSRRSMPPAGAPQERPRATPPLQTEQTHSDSPPLPAAQQSLGAPEQQSPPRRKYLSSKSRSIFTPIDDGSSVLAHFLGRPPDPGRSAEIKEEEDSPAAKYRPRKQAAAVRAKNQPARTKTMSSDGTGPPSRANTSSSAKSAAARPRLKVQIPSEASDGESSTAEGVPSAGPRQVSEGGASGAVGGAMAAGTAGGPSAPGAATTSTTTPSSRRRSDSHHSSGVVLPAPSPSASTLLSAGATGPPNPFARPPPPQQPATGQQSNNTYADNRNNIETPISALPSRFVADNLLPSPSSFYPDWGFGGGGRSSGGAGAHDSGILPSPLAFPTPIVSTGGPPGWGRTATAPGSGPAAGADGANAATTTSAAGEKRKSSVGGLGDDQAGAGRMDGVEGKKVRV